MFITMKNDATEAQKQAVLEALKNMAIRDINDISKTPTSVFRCLGIQKQWLTIKEAIQQLPGVDSVNINYPTKVATVA